MKGMVGVASKVPRGWRNIQVVHLKTVDSIALPVYHSLPPEATLLATLPPAEKRVKLSDKGEVGGGVSGDLGEVSEEEDGENVTTPLATPQRREKVTEQSF